MTLNEYQEQAMTTCMESSENFAYMFLNLVGEVGEFASKIAKAIRKKQVSIGSNTSIGRNCFMVRNDNPAMLDFDVLAFDEELKKEAGDILWQLSGLCSVMGWSLEEVAQMNLDKLAARKAVGTIDGSGDGIIREK
jgi:NTP pyrophosphatase (non-canonical NTP hydrolase)